MKINKLYVEYIDLLKGEYKEVFQRINIYILACGEDEVVTSSIMSEILDLFLSAQEDNTDIKDIIGNDYELFCNQIIKGHKTSTFKKFLSILRFYMYFFLVICVIESLGLIIDYSESVPSPWNVRFEMMNTFIGIGISVRIIYLFNKVQKRLIFKFKWYTDNLNNVLTFGLIILIIVLCFIIPETYVSQIAVPRYILIPSTLILFIVMQIVEKRKKKKEIHVPDDYIDFKDLFFNEIIKQYRKKNEKYLKKCSKKQIAPLDVKTWYERRYKKDRKTDNIGRIVFIVFITILLFQTYINSTFIDATIFTIIMLIIEIPLYRFLDKGRVQREKLYYHIKEKDTDINDDNLLRNM